MIFGIRPEEIRNVEEGAQATVGIVEPSGAGTYVITQSAGREVTLALYGRAAIAPGQRIGLSFSPRAATFSMQEPYTA